jgi:hypothetical protein
MSTTRRRTDDDDFEHGVLRDGHVARTPMLTRDGNDGLSPLQRAIRDSSPNWNEMRDRRRKRTVRYDPRGRVAGTSETEEIEEDAMHDAPRRPGFTRDALDRIEAAYREVELRDANAWKHLKDADVGDPASTGIPALDAELTIAANLDNATERAYAEVEARDRHAWKRPL